MSESRLSGRRIWLTGASSGIGAALAQELASRGARLALTARRREPLEAFAATRPGTLVLPGDVSDREAMLAIGREIDAAWQGLDIVILNAGTYRPVTPDTFHADIFREHFDVNVMGAVHGIEAVLPGMANRRSGRIAVVASVTGFAALPMASAYGATKAFLISMCDSLRADLTGSGVAVTVIAPGFVTTPLTAQNDFDMPFEITASAAARVIADGLEGGDDEIAFPKRMAFAMKFLGALPGPLRRRYVARIARRRSASTRT